MVGYVCAIDQGTTGSRSVIVDRDGRIVSTAYQTHEQYYPEPGWVEHDPDELWTAVESVVRTALNRARIGGTDLAAIGLTNQRETTVLWDRVTGEPLHRAIVWQDRRTSDRIDGLDAERAWIRETTGLEPDAYFAATKIEWLLDHLGVNVRRRAERGDLCVGTIDSWLLANLTGIHATDVTNASRTMLFDIRDLTWDEALLETFGVPEALLPTVEPSMHPTAYGETDPDGPFGAAVPVTGVLGDQQAALVGQTCFAPGEAKNTYGTGSFVLMHTGETPVRSEHGLLTTIAYQRAGEPVQYALEGSIFITGAAIEWLVDVDLLADPGESEAVATEVEGTDGVVFVPAFTGLGAPHWDQRARGSMFGLTRGTRRGHIVRAALEAIAYQTRDVIDAMESDADVTLSRLSVDGGAVKNDFLCQYQADVLGVPIDRPVIDETTAVGAAYAAGLAVGYWSSTTELIEHVAIDRSFDPEVHTESIERRYARWQQAVDRAGGWAIDGNSHR